jgi:F0F1-type ATP synthase membrane subunit c/vacuolar-type H+-ATPase subunit K
MGVWQVIAWLALAALTVFRVALLVGVTILIVAIVRGVLGARAANQSS